MLPVLLGANLVGSLACIGLLVFGYSVEWVLLLFLVIQMVTNIMTFTELAQKAIASEKRPSVNDRPMPPT